MEKEEVLRLLYLYLAAVYAALAAYTVWAPFWGWAARYTYSRGAASMAAVFELLPYALAAAGFVAVLAYAPSLALLSVALGAAAGAVAGASVWLPVALSLGSAFLYQLATRPRGEARLGPGAATRVALLEAGFAAASAALAAAAAPLLAGIVSLSPPGFLPELASRAWSALSSTLLGRLLIYAALVAALSLTARRLSGSLMAVASPRLAALEARGRLAEALRPLRPRLLVEALSQASILSSLVYGAAAAYTAWAAAGLLVAAAASPTERAAIAGLAAATAWIAYMVSKRLVDYMLLGRPRWGLLAALSAGTLAAAAAAAAAYRGPQGLAELLAGTWDPLAALQVEQRLLRLYESLEAQLRLLVALIWG